MSPANLKYTESHEWVRTEADGTLTIGITDHAQEALGDLVFIELPQVGRTVKAGEAIAVVESVKAASDIYAPRRRRSGRGQHAGVTETPEQVNADAYANWLFKLKPADTRATSATLLDAAAYAKVVGDA